MRCKIKMKQDFNYYKPLNLNIMKKLILIAILSIGGLAAGAAAYKCSCGDGGCGMVEAPPPTSAP